MRRRRLRAGVERDPEVAAVDLTGGGEAGAGVAEGRAQLEPVNLEVQRHLTRDPAERELAVDDERAVVDPDAGRAVRELRVMVDVEEVGRAEVGVAVGIGGVDRRQHHRRLDAGGERILAGHEGAGEFGEAAS